MRITWTIIAGNVLVIQTALIAASYTDTVIEIIVEKAKSELCTHRAPEASAPAAAAKVLSR